MKVSILKEKLKEIIDIVSNICPKKTDLNILNYFYISAKNDEVYISATDLELNYQTKFPARVFNDGEILIPAKQFEQIIDNFYSDEVNLEAKNNILEIRGEKSVSVLPGLIQEEFPTFSEINFDNYFEIDNEIFENALEKLIPILNTSDIRPEYSGVYFDLNDNILNLVCTDTVRLGLFKIKPQYYETNINKINVLLPKRIIQEYKRLKRKTGKLKIYFEENQVTFEILNHFLTTKILALDYPNYKQFTSNNSFILTFFVDTKDILNSLRLARVFLDQFKEVELNFNLSDNKLEIYSHNELLGENRSFVDIEVNDNTLIDKEFKIKFHLDFIYDGFSVIESDKVFCGFFNSLNDITPLYLKSPIDENFVYITVHR